MKFHKIFFILLLHVTCISCSSSLLIERAAYYANFVFKDFITSVVWGEDTSDDVTRFIKQFHGCIVLTPVQKNTNDTAIQQFNINQNFMQTVVFATTVNDLEYYIEIINQGIVKPIRLIAVLTEPATNDEFSELMETAWNNDVGHILIVSSKLNAEDVLLTTYFPYSNGKCDDFTPVHLDQDTKELFPKKFTKYNGCEIRATLLHMSPYSRLTFKNDTLESISGIDGNVLNVLLEVLNAKINVVSAKDHGGPGTIVNGTATGSFADIVNREADILLPALIMSQLRYPYVQFSHVFESVNIFWFAPRRREISEWLRVLQPFMTNITPALFATSILFIAVTMAVRRFGVHRSFPNDSVLFQSFVVFLGQEVKFMTKSWLWNSIFMLWIWFCMVVRIAYQGDLVDKLQKTILESPFQSFETAVKEADGYGGVEAFREFFNGTQYYDNYKVIRFRNVTHYLKAIETGKRFLLVTDRLVGLDSAPSSQVIYNDPVTQGPVCFYMRPGWPAVAEIDKLFLHMIEAGFIQKVLRNHFWEWAKNRDSIDDHGAKPLTLGTLIGCFYGLGVLYAVCTFVFFIELIIYYKVKRPADR